MLEGKARGLVQPKGARLPMAAVDLRLAGGALDLPEPDPEFTRQVTELLGEDAERYGIAVLDLSDPARPVYAEHRADQPFNPGSVGKLMVATALFQRLADLYRDDITARERVLREARVVADEFIVHDSHTVPFWDGHQFTHRPLQQGERGQPVDLSRLDALGELECRGGDGGAGADPARALRPRLSHRPRARCRLPARNAEGRALGPDAQGPRRGDPAQRPGSGAAAPGGFFTATGKARVPGTTSTATPRELMTWLLRLEEGRIVDTWTSREIKRLLYMTQRRIRYASSPALLDAAVYFKSGSFFRCRPEPGFVCRKYQGNVENLLNSVAIVEHPAEGRRLHYMVVVTSNVLRKNSAVAHQTLGTRLQQLLELRHAEGGTLGHGLVEPDDQAAQP